MAASRPRVNVVWFKCTDLRTHDHAALKAAHSEGLPVVHLYVFDPFWYAGRSRLCGFPKTGPLRTRFQLEAIADLGKRLETAGHVLSTRTRISTAACFEELCEDYTVNSVFAFHEVCSEERRIERQVREILHRRGQGPLRLFWGFELYHCEDLSFDPFTARGPFNSYTAFRKRVEEGWPRPSSRENPEFVRGTNSSMRWHRSDSSVPSVAEVMGDAYDASADPGEEKDARAELRWRGGESAALDRVQQYLWNEDSLGLDYVGATMTMDPAKSCMRDKAMSKLSPWLAHGCLSPRLLYEEVHRYEKERRKNKSTYWIVHELLWRDFVRFGSMQAGTSIFKIGGLKNAHPSWRWSSDRDILRAWTDGRTGFPFIDCFMRELKTTGYCNHMGRECAGWFLAGDLGIDWRMGAEWFEYVLLDYEPTANWYNWTYRCLPAAGRGGGHADPGQRLQGLEILKWGTQHDPDATYIKRWIPELAPLPATVAREPWRLGLLDNAGAAPTEGALRPRPKGRFDVSRTQLAQVLSLGFDESEAAIALYRAWNDPEAAVALLISERENEGAKEEEDFQRAIMLSLEGQSGSMSGNATQPTSDPIEVDDDLDEGRRGLPHGGFKYGEDYPKPIIQPVSLVGTEEAEEAARRDQARRDQQIAGAKRQQVGHQKGGGGKGGNSKGARTATSTENLGFDKAQWESRKQRWNAETPTGARWRADRANETWEKDPRGGEGGGFSASGAGSSHQGKGGAGGAERKRRWKDNRRQMNDDPAHGG